MATQKRYTTESKAAVALEAIREELTTAELAQKYDVHPTMINGRLLTGTTGTRP